MPLEIDSSTRICQKATNPSAVWPEIFVEPLVRHSAEEEDECSHPRVHQLEYWIEVEPFQVWLPHMGEIAKGPGYGKHQGESREAVASGLQAVNGAVFSGLRVGEVDVRNEPKQKSKLK